MSGDRYEIMVDPACTLEVFGKAYVVPETVCIDGPTGNYSSPSETLVGAIRQQQADIKQLRAELARERETNAVLRREIADPSPDVQELALKQCGHFEIVTQLRAELAAVTAERNGLKQRHANLMFMLTECSAERDQLRARLAAIAKPRENGA